MANAKRGTERREDALSRERIVDAAVELLDAEGESGLTFRALAMRLATGPGAIYWHIANKSELLVAATDAVVAHTISAVRASATPREAIRAIAVGIFDAVDAHPWAGTQLSRAPWDAATLQLFERFGRQIQALGAKRGVQFTAASALVSYVLGVSIQNATQSRQLDPTVGRTAFLEGEAARWKALDDREYAFTRSLAEKLRKHDDRAEFLSGIDLIVAGIEASL